MTELEEAVMHAIGYQASGAVHRLLAVLEAARIGHGNDVDDHDCPLCIAVHACDRDPLLSTNAPLQEET